MACKAGRDVGRCQGQHCGEAGGNTSCKQRLRNVHKTCHRTHIFLRSCQSLLVFSVFCTCVTLFFTCTIRACDSRLGPSSRDDRRVLRVSQQNILSTHRVCIDSIFFLFDVTTILNNVSRDADRNQTDPLCTRQVFREYTPTACMTYIQSFHKHARM